MYLENKIINLLCVDFFVSLSQDICLLKKFLLDHTNLFSPNGYKKNEDEYISISKINMFEEASLEFRLRKVDETKNWLLDEIIHND